MDINGGVLAEVISLARRCQNASMCRQVYFVVDESIQHCCSWSINQGAAMLMVHSEQQWRKWYDTQFHQ